MLGAKRPQDIGEVGHRCDVDHPEPNAPGRRRLQPLRPVDQVSRDVTTRRAWSSTGAQVVRSTRRRPSRLEQLHADPPFEFGKALRQRRRAHPDAIGRDRPRRCVGDCDEVLQLTDRDVGQTGAR